MSREEFLSNEEEKMKILLNIEDSNIDETSRTIHGIIAEFGAASNDSREIILKHDALKPRQPLSKVKLLIDHDMRQPIGFMTSLEDTKASFYIPESDAGDKALKEAKQGLRDGLSVGITCLSYEEHNEKFIINDAELYEVSLVAIPAFAGAHVTKVTASKEDKKEEKMSITLEELDKANSDLKAEISREFDAKMQAFQKPKKTQPQYKNVGHFLKELVQGNDQAMSFALTLSSDLGKFPDTNTPNTWVNDAIHLINQRRRIMALFGVEALPAEGMTLEYLTLKSNTMSVEKQENEGDALPFGKIELDSSTTPVKTYGGYTALSRQIIDRASAAYLTTANQAMDLEYARATEAVVRAKLNEIIQTRLPSSPLELDLSTATAFDWLDLIVDSSMLFDDRGYSLDGALVSADVFKLLMRLEDSSGNALMNIFGQGINQVGEIDLRGITGSLASVRFSILPDAEPLTMEFHDRIGITTWESPGAPWRLQDQDTISLTESFSKYGYLACASQYPDAIEPVRLES